MSLLKARGICALNLLPKASTSFFSTSPALNTTAESKTRKRTVLSESLLKDLSKMVGSQNVSINKQVLLNHGKDEGHFPSVPPDAVIFVENKEQVQSIASFCHHHVIPIIPYGAGTGLEGGVNALEGGISVDLTKINQILQVNQEDFDCRVQPGVTWRDLNAFLRDTGLWFPVDPGASATLGGMASTGASGTNAVRYGTMKNNVLNLEVVLPGGQVINTSGKKTRSRKTSAGYNLTELFVGSEGTFGIITELSLRLKATPGCIASAVCQFPDITSCVKTAMEILQNDIPIARMELMDDMSIEAVIKYSKLDDNVISFESGKPALFFEFHATSEEDVKRDVDAVRDISGSNGGDNEFPYETDLEKRALLWKARHQLYYACLNIVPNSKGVVTDVAVPISCLVDMVTGAQDIFKRNNVVGPIHGHVGDGNFHSVLLFQDDSDESRKRLKDVANELALLAISLGGTCTGEHGIGRGKIDLLVQQFGYDSIQAMKSIKHALDPKNIMNPGKLFP